MKQTDFLIIGSGIAGLTYALRVAQHFKKAKITIITKANKSESNTKYAQAGIATVLDSELDSFQQHISDTIIAGDGLCDKEVVKMVVEEGPERLRELISWGAQFDETNTGNLDLFREGGHSQNRIAHHKDITGYEIERALLAMVGKTSNIEILPEHFAIDLITEHQIKNKKVIRNFDITCYGAYVLNQKKDIIETFISKVTMLASGGLGQVYETTTNPRIATGDGIGLAYRAKAQIEDIEFIQFHPTALYNPQQEDTFLISEAVRGFGAKLRNKKGDFFIHKYDNRNELASRDIVARAIDAEMKKTGDNFVYLDCSSIEKEKFDDYFPRIKEKCKSIGIDIEKDWIPVLPAAHYLCGGIKVNKNGKTTLTNLYACGECTRTGLHGANRLASNSLLEALVFSQKSFEDIVDKYQYITMPSNIPNWNPSNTFENEEEILISQSRIDVQQIMSHYVGIVRSDKRLERAIKRLDVIYKETEILYKKSKITIALCELRNLITSAYLITQFSINRKENRGGFFNIDLQ